MDSHHPTVPHHVVVNGEKYVREGALSLSDAMRSQLAKSLQEYAGIVRERDIELEKWRTGALVKTLPPIAASNEPFVRQYYSLAKAWSEYALELEGRLKDIRDELEDDDQSPREALEEIEDALRASARSVKPLEPKMPYPMPELYVPKPKGANIPPFPTANVIEFNGIKYQRVETK